MYRIISLLLGGFISIMILMNGGLAQRYGLYSSVVIIHVFGFLLIGVITLLKREKLFQKRYSPVLYLGGITGILTILFANYAFQYLSISAILALGLLGQCIMSFLIDQFGLFGMPTYTFTKRRLLGLCIIFIGSMIMIQGFEAWAAFLALLSGICIVLSRTINARLTEESNLIIGTCYHFFFGLLAASVLFVLLGDHEVSYPTFGIDPFSSNWYIYLGGIVGVFVILVSNIVVSKISSIHMTMLLFIGQVLAGLSIDFHITSAFSVELLIGVLIVSIGLFINIGWNQKNQQQSAQNVS